MGWQTKSMKRRGGSGPDKSQRETPDNPKGHKLGPRMPEEHVFGLLSADGYRISDWQAQAVVKRTGKRAFLQMSRTVAKGDLFWAKWPNRTWVYVFMNAFKPHKNTERPGKLLGFFGGNCKWRKSQPGVHASHCKISRS